MSWSYQYLTPVALLTIVSKNINSRPDRLMPALKQPPIENLIDRYLNYLLIEKGLSSTTLESYSADIVRYQEFLHKNKTDRISAADTALILKHLISLRDAGLSARSRARSFR